ncbi:hypothetical protein HDU77_004888 [Chytriomyces hyalinus]|nr:hypothetical protein HDU77_004888 [Chytriomyces hyalinus]
MIPIWPEIVAVFEAYWRHDPLAHGFAIEFGDKYPIWTAAIFAILLSGVMLPGTLAITLLANHFYPQKIKPHAHITRLTRLDDRKKVVLCSLQQEESKPFPNASPFVCKVDAALRDCGVSFQTEVVKYEELPTGKVPLVHWNNELLMDSQLIVERFVAEGVIEKHPDAWMSDAEKAAAAMLRLGFENFMYWGMMKERWMDQWKVSKHVFWPKKTTDWTLRFIVCELFIQPNVVSAIKKAGVLSYSAQDWDKIVDDFYSHAAVILGDKQYFFSSEQMCMADYAVFGHILNVLDFEEMNPKLAKSIKRHANLVAFSERVKTKLYPELAMSLVAGGGEE